MRVRVITQTFSDLWRHRAIMNPFRSGFYAIQLLSHKVMRYLVPLFLVIIFVTSAILASHSTLYALALLAQVLFLAAAALAWVLERSGKSNRLLALPYYFVLTNLASLLAAHKFLTGERYARWEPIREPVEGSAGATSTTLTQPMSHPTDGRQ